MKYIIPFSFDEVKIGDTIYFKRTETRGSYQYDKVVGLHDGIVIVDFLDHVVKPERIAHIDRRPRWMWLFGIYR